MGVLKMTLTTGQVQDLQTTIKNDLEAGTWTNYASTPKVHIEKQKKTSKNTWIEILNTTGNFMQAVNGAIILFEDQCELQIHAQNRTDINKLYVDVLNILVATSRSYMFSRSSDIPRRSKYTKSFMIKLKDI